MLNPKWIICDDRNGKYLISGPVPYHVWGAAKNAVTYPTEVEANAAAVEIKLKDEDLKPRAVAVSGNQ